jgi:chemosensory pili system protein ChpA (sensor histidine kinase/response regulator)
MKPRNVDVLIIENQQFDVDLVLRALRFHAPDLTAAVATTGGAAIEYLETQSPKAILLDLHLPDMDGCDVLRQIRGDSRFHNIPVLVLTGFAADRHRNEAHGLGISGYINKSSDVHSMAEHLLLFKHLLHEPNSHPSETS